MPRLLPASERTPFNFDLFVALLRREISSRYVGSVGGLAWMLIHPVFLLGLYGIVFSFIFRVNLRGGSVSEQSYLLYVALALWPWIALQEGIMKGLTALQANAALIKKCAFRQDLLIFSAVFASFLIHGLGYAFVLLVLALFGYPVAWQYFIVGPMMMAVLFGLAVGLGLMLSGIQLFIKDTENIIGQVFSYLFYASPIIYPLAMVPDWLLGVVAFNPLSHVFSVMRAAALQGAWPSPAIVVALLMVVGLLFALGRVVFFRLQPYFEDVA